MNAWLFVPRRAPTSTELRGEKSNREGRLENRWGDCVQDHLRRRDVSLVIFTQCRSVPVHAIIDVIVSTCVVSEFGRDVLVAAALVRMVGNQGGRGPHYVHTVCGYRKGVTAVSAAIGFRLRRVHLESL